MADTIAPPRPAPELGLIATARRERWSRERLCAELLVAATTLTVEEVERLVEAVATPEGSRRRADPRLA